MLRQLRRALSAATETKGPRRASGEAKSLLPLFQLLSWDEASTAWHSAATPPSTLPSKKALIKIYAKNPSMKYMYAIYNMHLCSIAGFELEPRHLKDKQTKLSHASCKTCTTSLQTTIAKPQWLANLKTPFAANRRCTKAIMAGNFEQKNVTPKTRMGCQSENPPVLPKEINK